MQDIRSGARDYEILYRDRNRIRTTYLLLLFLLTTLVFFASSWLALFLSKQVTRPVEALADAMDAVAAGHYAHRVKVAATEELGELVRSFNRMAEDLEESRALAETSTTQLSAANRALEERRSELETVLETIPSGVVTLDPADVRSAGKPRLAQPAEPARSPRPFGYAAGVDFAAGYRRRADCAACGGASAWVWRQRKSSCPAPAAP